VFVGRKNDPGALADDVNVESFRVLLDWGGCVVIEDARVPQHRPSLLEPLIRPDRQGIDVFGSQPVVVEHLADLLL